MLDAKELEDLESLVLSPGWGKVKERFDAEWGAAGNRFIGAIDRVANDLDKQRAAENMQIVIMVRKEMTTFMKSIEQRVAELRNKKAPEVSMSRRGVL